MDRLAYLVIGAALAVVVMTLVPQARGVIGATGGPRDSPLAAAPIRTKVLPAASADADAGAAAGAGMAGMEMAAMDPLSGAGTMHRHPLRPVSEGQPVPGVTHLMFPDAMDGYNIQILPMNFTFTPAAINREVVDNQGHAHVYLNGVKIARVYGPWYHLPGALLSPGDNLVTVSLNANDHSEWAKGGAAITSSVTVPGPAATR